MKNESYIKHLFREEIIKFMADVGYIHRFILNSQRYKVGFNLSYKGLMDQRVL